MALLIAFHSIFGSSVLGPPQKDYFFNVPRRGSFGRILTMQLEPPKPLNPPPCPQNTFHPVPTPQTPFPTAPMPSKHISPSANSSNPLFNCPQKIFHPMPTQQTHFAAAPMPSKQISHGASTSNTLFNCPRAPKTHFIQCQHLKPPLQLPPCPQRVCILEPSALATDVLPLGGGFAGSLLGWD